MTSLPETSTDTQNGKKFRLVVRSAEEAVRVIRDKLGDKAKVLSVRQVGGEGLKRFISSPKLEVIAQVVEDGGAEMQEQAPMPEPQRVVPETKDEKVAVSPKQPVQTQDVSSSNISDENKLESAIRDFTTIAKQDPPDPLVLGQLGMLHLAAKQPRAAIDWFGKSLNLNKTLFLSLRGRSDALISIGEHKKAARDLKAALKLHPEDSGVLNNLAWLFATSPDDDLRDATQAIELATKACEETEWKAAHIISTLAAGYAESGDFKKACKFSQKALDADAGKGGLDEQLQKELSSYEEKKPWREKQSMAEAELQDDEIPPDDLEESSEKENIGNRKKQRSSQEEPRRPFD